MIKIKTFKININQIEKNKSLLNNKKILDNEEDEKEKEKELNKVYYEINYTILNSKSKKLLDLWIEKSKKNDKGGVPRSNTINNNSAISINNNDNSIENNINHNEPFQPRLLKNEKLSTHIKNKKKSKLHESRNISNINDNLKASRHHHHHHGHHHKTSEVYKEYLKSSNQKKSYDKDNSIYSTTTTTTTTTKNNENDILSSRITYNNNYDSDKENEESRTRNENDYSFQSFESLDTELILLENEVFFFFLSNIIYIY